MVENPFICPFQYLVLSILDAVLFDTRVCYTQVLKALPVFCCVPDMLVILYALEFFVSNMETCHILKK